nr:hypothetical protein [Tanacetum cinerariifolium]
MILHCYLRHKASVLPHEIPLDETEASPIDDRRSKKKEMEERKTSTIGQASQGKVALPEGRTDKGDTNDIRIALRKAKQELLIWSIALSYPFKQVQIGIEIVTLIWGYQSGGKVALPEGRTDKGDTNDIRIALRKAKQGNEAQRMRDHQ